MKLYITFVAVALVVISKVQAFPTKVADDENEVWPIPQINGEVRLMTLEEATKEADQEEHESLEALDKVRFFLYTEENPNDPIEIDMEDPETLVRSGYNFNYPTRFMIHGWNGGHNAGWSIREALLVNGTNKHYNFISVDWSVYAKSKFYISSQKSCKKTGKIIAEFIDWMYDNAKLSFDTLALYGHSLGAHVAGFTGKNVKKGKIHTIVGMDPAMPLFNFKNSNGRLSSKDALYVETIQTNGGLLGFFKPIGKAAFYPNGGRAQPGCGTDTFCSHGRSVEYFAEALRLNKKNGFLATGCSDLENVQDGTCTKHTLKVRLGDPNNYKTANGIYYLETNSESPYSGKKS